MISPWTWFFKYHISARLSVDSLLRMRECSWLNIPLTHLVTETVGFSDVHLICWLVEGLQWKFLWRAGMKHTELPNPAFDKSNWAGTWISMSVARMLCYIGTSQQRKHCSKKVWCTRSYAYIKASCVTVSVIQMNSWMHVTYFYKESWEQ